MVQIGQAHFSVKYLVASILIFWSGLCTLVAFAGPYWSQSYPSTGNEFKNIGLWEACFNRYRHWKDDNQKPYTGCFWFWSPDMIRFRDWLMPRKLHIYRRHTYLNNDDDHLSIRYRNYFTLPHLNILDEF